MNDYTHGTTLLPFSPQCSPPMPQNSSKTRIFSILKMLNSFKDYYTSMKITQQNANKKLSQLTQNMHVFHCRIAIALLKILTCTDIANTGPCMH